MPARIHRNLWLYHWAIHRVNHATFYRWEISIFRKVRWWIMQLSGAAGITDCVSFSTESYGRNSVKASHRRPVRDLYKLGFMIASVSGGLLFILTLYCLITQKVGYQRFCFVNSWISCALIKSSHAFQSYCNKAGLGSFCLCSLGHSLLESTSPPPLVITEHNKTRWRLDLLVKADVPFCSKTWSSLQMFLGALMFSEVSSYLAPRANF